jgi:hypothetical protein
MVLEKCGEDQLRRVIEVKIKGRTEVTESPGPGLKKKIGLSSKGEPAKNLCTKLERLSVAE